MQVSGQKARKKGHSADVSRRSDKLGAFYASPRPKVQRKLVMLATGTMPGRLPMQGTGAFICGATMPTYEYSCEKCDHQFDVFQSIKDKPLTVCPKEKC